MSLLITWTIILGSGYIGLMMAAYLIDRIFPVSKGQSIDRYYLWKLFGWGVFLHRIHHSDPRGLFHNHPWSGLSLIWGGYAEETWERGADGVPEVDVKIRWFWNWVPAKRHHRVIVNSPVWTLFIHGPKCNLWTVIDTLGVVKAEAPWEGAGTGRSYENV